MICIFTINVYSLKLTFQVEQTKRFALTANASSVEFELRDLFPYTLYSMNAVIWIKKGKRKGLKHLYLNCL